MIHHFDHRWATHEPDGTTRHHRRKSRPHLRRHAKVLGRGVEVDERLDGKVDTDWLLGWRDVCRSTDERTMIIIRPVARRRQPQTTACLHIPPRLLAAVWSSFVRVRPCRPAKIGGTSMTYFYLETVPHHRHHEHQVLSVWSVLPPEILCHLRESG